MSIAIGRAVAASQPAAARPAPMSRAYAELRRTVLAAGLLDRAYGYYLLRGASSFLLLGLAVAAVFVLPPTLAWGILEAVLLALSTVQVGLIGHDAGHLAVFRRAPPNWALGQACWSLGVGVGFWYWYDRHTRHHTRTNDLGADPDLQWAALIAYTETTLQERSSGLRWLTRHQAILGPILTLGLAYAFRVEGWRHTYLRLRGRRRVVEAVLLASSLALWLAPTPILGWHWVWVLLVGQALAGTYLALIIAPNHKGMPTWSAGTPLSYLERQVLSSRNVAPGPIADFLFGGLNYQVEHHLFPTMPRVHYGRARAIVRPFCLAHGLPYDERGAWSSYRLVLAELRRVGQATVHGSPSPDP